MATEISLQNLLDEADEKHGSLVIDVAGTKVELRSAMQLGKKERKALSNLVPEDEVDGEGNVIVNEDADITDVFQSWADIVCADKAGAKALKDKMGDNVARWKIVQEHWTKATNAGEASPSES